MRWEEFYTLELEIIFNFLRYFLIAGLVFFVFYVAGRKRFLNLKIQKQFPALHRIRSEIFFSVLTLTVFCATAWFVFFMKAQGWTMIYTDIHEYGYLYLVLSLGLIVFLHDTYFYWTHRLLHIRLIFNRVHIRHHLSHNPTPWSAFSFHPVEAVIASFFLPIVVVLIPLHPVVIFLFMLLMVTVNVLGHAGFEWFPRGFRQHWLGKWQNVPTYHDHHHRSSGSNFGLYFTFWDRWMKTFTDTAQVEKKEPEEQSGQD